MTDFGAWTLLPPVLAIVFAMVTRRVYQSLVLGILVAGVMKAGGASFGDGLNPVLAVFASIAGGFIEAVRWLVSGVANEGHAAVITFTLFLGALIALMQKSGAIKGFGDAAIRFAHNARRGQALAWGVGALFLAIDDYFHVIAAGAMFRPLTDGLRISREKLAYIIDSTAAPMVILVPISTWVGVILGIVAPVLAAHSIDKSAFAAFLEGIPYNFYAILTVTFVGIVALTRIEYGPMRHAERRAGLEGKLIRDGAKPLMSRELAEMEPAPGAIPRWWNLALPVLFLFAAALTMLYVTGYDAADPDRDSFYEALQNASAEVSLAIASFLALLFAMVLYSFQGFMKQDRFLDTVLDGFKAMVPALGILALAWAIGDAVGPQTSGGIGLASYLADTVGDSIPVYALPLLAFVLSAVIAFATGTSFGTFAIMLPVTLGLAAASSDVLQWISPVLAATIGGAVFGDHCSPISDTTVMSSMAGQSDHIDHVRTQLPYALTVAGIAAAGYGALALTGELWVAWLGNVILLATVFLIAWLAAGRLAKREAA